MKDNPAKTKQNKKRKHFLSLSSDNVLLCSILAALSISHYKSRDDKNLSGHLSGIGGQCEAHSQHQSSLSNTTFPSAPLNTAWPSRTAGTQHTYTGAPAHACCPNHVPHHKDALPEHSYLWSSCILWPGSSKTLHYEYFFYWAFTGLGEQSQDGSVPVPHPTVPAPSHQTWTSTAWHSKPALSATVIFSLQLAVNYLCSPGSPSCSSGCCHSILSARDRMVPRGGKWLLAE